jgi:hypothetical protein
MEAVMTQVKGYESMKNGLGTSLPDVPIQDCNSQIRPLSDGQRYLKKYAMTLRFVVGKSLTFKCKALN